MFLQFVSFLLCLSVESINLNIFLKRVGTNAQFNYNIFIRAFSCFQCQCFSAFLFPVGICTVWNFKNEKLFNFKIYLNLLRSGAINVGDSHLFFNIQSLTLIHHLFISYWDTFRDPSYSIEFSSHFSTYILLITMKMFF